LHDHSKFEYCTGGAANKIDITILGKSHIYQHFTAESIFDPTKQFKIAHDPEGILGKIFEVVNNLGFHYLNGDYSESRKYLYSFYYFFYHD
jgi:hypothetical protein